MRKWLIALLIFLVVLTLLFIGVYVVFLKKSVNQNPIILKNPIKNIINSNKDVNGKINEQLVINQGVKEFNSEYINYILFALGVGNLHKSLIGYGNPVIEFHLDNKIWNSELVDNILTTKLGTNENKDLIIIMSKEEAVNALLSTDIKIFMKTSVTNGNTQINVIAGNVELGSKGYLEMYDNLKS